MNYHHRIELDSVVERVGGEGLWEYIIHQARSPEFSPGGFNLGKVVELPDDEEFYPRSVIIFQAKVEAWTRKQLEIVDDYAKRLLECRKRKIRDELEHHELVKSKDKEKKIRENLETEVENNRNSDDWKKIDTRFEKLVEHLDKFQTLLETESTSESNTTENRHVDPIDINDEKL